jgi:hypothetical protein
MSPQGSNCLYGVKLASRTVWSGLLALAGVLPKNLAIRLLRLTNRPLPRCARFSPGSANRCGQVTLPSWADFITTTSGFRLSVRRGQDHAAAQYVANVHKQPMLAISTVPECTHQICDSVFDSRLLAPGVALSQPVAAECWLDGAQSRKCCLQSPVTDRAAVAPSRR